MRALWLYSAALILTVGPLLVLSDHLFHVRTGVLTHHWGPYLGEQSMWVIPMFVAAAAAMVLFAVFLPVRASDSVPWLAIANSIGIVVGAYALTGWLGNEHAGLLLAVLLGTWLIRWIFTPHRALVAGCALLLATTGPLIEGLVSMAGLFDYAHPDVSNVPWWLFALYLHGGFAFVPIAEGAQALKAQARVHSNPQATAA